jgi:hypothetical protein
MIAYWIVWSWLYVGGFIPVFVLEFPTNYHNLHYCTDLVARSYVQYAVQQFIEERGRRGTVLNLLRLSLSMLSSVLTGIDWYWLGW